MEVHHQSHTAHHEHRGKKFREYLLEFFMLFLAVTLGFFAENFREHITEHAKETSYIKSLVEDLKEDTAAVAEYDRINLKMTHGQDSLIDLLTNYTDTGTTDQKCYHYFFFYTTRFAEVVFNDRTISQLLNAGNMRLITNQPMSDSIMDYNSVVKYVKSQADAYRQYFIKTLDMSMDIFNFSYARTDMDKEYHLHLHAGTEKPHFRLLTTNRDVLNKYVNMLSLSKSILEGYILNLKLAGDKATALIRLLNKGYHLDRE